MVNRMPPKWERCIEMPREREFPHIAGCESPDIETRIAKGIGECRIKGNKVAEG